MAKTTTTLALPYPEATDSDNVPSNMKALAEAVETAVLARLLTSRVQAKRVTTKKLNNGEAEQISINWSTAFVDTSYTVSLSMERIEGPGAAASLYFYSKVKTGITLNVVNNSGSASAFNVEALAIHD